MNSKYDFSPTGCLVVIFIFAPVVIGSIGHYVDLENLVNQLKGVLGV